MVCPGYKGVFKTYYTSPWRLWHVPNQFYLVSYQKNVLIILLHPQGTVREGTTNVGVAIPLRGQGLVCKSAVFSVHQFSTYDFVNSSVMGIRYKLDLNPKSLSHQYDGRRHLYAWSPGTQRIYAKYVNSQRSLKNLNRTFDPSSIGSSGGNYPRFFTLDLEETPSRTVNR